MKYDDDHYTLSTGRTFYANGGILGLSPRRSGYGEQRLQASEGYDGGLNFEHDEDEALTAVEQREIADYMIALWNEWAAQSPKVKE